MDGNLEITSVPATINTYLGKPSIGKNERIYIIPPYQREYTWSRDEWSDLYDDLTDSISSTRKHFIGTFMFIESTEDGRDIYNVVDGQQRLTTLSILFLVLSQLIFLNQSETTRGKG